MLRLTEIKLPLDHPEGDLRAAILARLGIADADLIEVSVYKRSYDARQKKQIQLIYTVDVTLRDDLEATVLKRQIAHVAPSPDMTYVYQSHPARIPLGPYARLLEELAEARLERDILKKATAYFARESLPGTRS